MEFIKKMIKKYREVIMYGIFGVLTTVVNYLTYYLVSRLCGLGINVSNIIAWVISVAFAYITNKIWVFESKDNSITNILEEIIKFIGARVFSLLLELVIMNVFVGIMGMNDLIIKIIANIIVIIINYVLSKFMIFKKNKE
ncbi:MAG: GtrA family protein [Clostridia bacterium]|nr:GtrA family protein [Clostridia bacterium]